KQVGLALMVTMDFAIPLFHQVYPGSQPDPVEFASVVDELVERYWALAGECEDVTLILDKGNNSKKNIAGLSDAMGFVGSLVPSHHPDLLAVPRSSFRPLEGPEFGGMLAYRTRNRVFGVPRTVVVTYNEALYLGQMQGLVISMRKANQRLKELKRSLDERHSGRKMRGKAPTVAGVQARVKKILRKPLDGIIKWQVTERDGRISLEYEIDHEAQKAYVEKYFGKNVLFTNRDQWSTEHIVLAYRGQECVERAFREMKDYDFIGWSPMYHWTDRKIRVHAFYCVLALTLSALLRRRLAKAGMEMSIASILEQLSGIYEVAHIYPPEARKKDTFTLSEMNEVQRKLAQTLDLEAMHRLAG
ncbi:MAG: IS1634 family transposase, partial [Bacillota bacterium]